jgi:hypothetical protein
VLLHAPFLLPTWDYYEAHSPRHAPATPVPSPAIDSRTVYSGADLVAYAPALSAATRVHLVVSHPTIHDPLEWVRAVEDAGFALETVVRDATSWGIDVYTFVRP